jgi:hypothetical protein
VGAPALMRGKERFSAPGNDLDSIMRFSAGNARAVPYGKKSAYVTNQRTAGNNRRILDRLTTGRLFRKLR